MKKHTAFDRIGDRPSLPEELASIILRQIEEGDFKLGDVLPSEQALAAMFHVSRTVVREALARLKFEGIIQSKRGSGPVVCALPGAKDGFDLPDIGSQENRLKIIEFRLIMEGECAALAAVRRTEEQLQAMYDCLQQMQQTIDERTSGLLPDYHFHCIMAEAADNEHISSFIKFLSAKILGVVQGARYLSNQDSIKAQSVYDEHLAIYEAIANKESAKARIAARTHMLNSASRQNLSLADHKRYL